jgi:beta-lactamase regulating signal transducer with metallopeptidase domain
MSALLLSLWVQITAVCLLALALSWTVLKRNPACRYALCAAVVVGCFCSPMAAWLAHERAWTSIKVPILTPPPAPHISESTPDQEPAREFTDAELAYLAATMSSTPTKAPTPLNWALFASAIWAVASAAAALRMAAGYRQILRIRRDARVASSPGLLTALTALQRCLGVRRLPLVLESDSVSGPVAIAWPSRCILVPSALCETLTTEQLRDVLAHELAHLEQRHAFLALVQRLTAIALWPHPLIHLVSRELSKAREEVCDNFVLQVSSAPGFAKTLLTVAETLPTAISYPAAAGLLLPRWRLEQRVSGLLDPKRAKAIYVSRSTMTIFSSSILSLTAVAAGVQLTYAQSSVEVRQGNKVYVLHPTRSHPVTVKVRKGSGTQVMRVGPNGVSGGNWTKGQRRSTWTDAEGDVQSPEFPVAKVQGFQWKSGGSKAKFFAAPSAPNTFWKVAPGRPGFWKAVPGASWPEGIPTPIAPRSPEPAEAIPDGVEAPSAIPAVPQGLMPPPALAPTPMAEPQEPGARGELPAPAAPPSSPRAGGEAPFYYVTKKGQGPQVWTYSHKSGEYPAVILRQMNAKERAEQEKMMSRLKTFHFSKSQIEALKNSQGSKLWVQQREMSQAQREALKNMLHVQSPQAQVRVEQLLKLQEMSHAEQAQARALREMEKSRKDFTQLKGLSGKTAWVQGKPFSFTFEQQRSLRELLTNAMQKAKEESKPEVAEKLQQLLDQIGKGKGE